MMKSNSSMGKAGLYSTGTGCLDEGARQASGEGLLQVDDRFDLRRPEAGGVERWQLAEPLGELLFLLHPGEQGLRTMERKDTPAARLGVEAVGERGLAAGAFVAERERLAPSRQAGRNAGHILG